MIMSEPSQDQARVSVDSVVEIQREKISELDWKNTLLEARLRDATKVIGDLMASKEAAPPSVT